jgi:phage protein D
MAINDTGQGWTVLDDTVFDRLTPVRLEVIEGVGGSTVIFDGYVIEARAQFSSGPGESALEVVAMDATALMDLEESVTAWPNMADSDIATAIFGNYGFATDVDQSQPTRQDTDQTVIQRDTDIHFVRELAERNGYECFLDVTSDPVTGHFHAPRLSQSPQGVLSVSLGEATNVTAFSVRYEMLKSVTASVAQVTIDNQSDQTAQATSASLTQLGQQSTEPADQPRVIILPANGLADGGELQTYVQAKVDQSTWAVSAEGELESAVYGSVLRAKQPVLVRGAGAVFSGTYYVWRVLHILTPQGYRQQFTLQRNAVGLTGSEAFSSAPGAA